VALTEIYLERLERLDATLHCTVTLLPERARAEARAAEAEIAAGRWRGPLHGIPYGLKDLFSTPDAPTTWGAEEFRDRVIDEESEVVVRLNRAGAVLVAKLTTGRFARGDGWFGGRTRNPWNPEQGSSGSSAGPASATVAGLVGFAIGTETQGSIVSPARRCGVSALRPTFGRVTRHGGMVLAWTMDKVGPIGRTVEDCALVFEAIHGSDPKDPSTLTTPFRFERLETLSGITIGYTEDAPEAFLETLRSMGATLAPMPELPSGGSSALSVEAAAAFDHLTVDGEGEPLEPDPRDGNRFLNGRSVRAVDHMQSQRARYQMMRGMADAMARVDMFVSGSGEVGLTNQTGHPAAIVPHAIREGENPQPICTTIIGHPFQDDRILSVAHAYQVATDWHRRHPTFR
jgi:Asp-tRNA(Asn)/Glu-tRNA(Gln) amidotransferase A subunit family amidase